MVLVMNAPPTGSSEQRLFTVDIRFSPVQISFFDVRRIAFSMSWPWRVALSLYISIRPVRTLDLGATGKICYEPDVRNRSGALHSGIAYAHKVHLNHTCCMIALIAKLKTSVTIITLRKCYYPSVRRLSTGRKQFYIGQTYSYKAFISECIQASGLSS